MWCRRSSASSPAEVCLKNEDGVIQASASAHIIEGGIPTEALLAQIAVSKYADGLPLYRQEAIYACDKVELDRKLMAQWMGKLGFELEILSDYLFDEIKKGERIFADEPLCRPSLLDPDRQRRPGFGPMPGMTGPSEAVVRRWWPIASRIVEPASVSPGI
ncbi:transposase IS66 family protein [Rhizobium azibense]|nr:transposase IS66 family protein [Rhizobium azibense]